MQTLKKIFQGMLAYKVPPSIPWGHIFKMMESLKKGIDPSDSNKTGPGFRSTLVEDYVVTDTSLEQVFLSLARETDLTPKNQHIPTEVITVL